MDKIIVDLCVDRVDLVDEGANSEAFIKIYKRKEEGGSAMTFEEILKSLPEDQRTAVEAEIEKEKAAKDAELAKAAADLKIANDKIAELSAEEDSEEEIMKNLDPSVKAIIEKSRKQAKAAEEAVKKMLEKEAETEAIAKAKDVSEVGVPEGDLVDLYKSLKNKDDALADKVFEVLQKANELVKQSNTFKEVGAGGEGATDAEAAWAKIEAKAEEVAKARKITVEAATTAVIDEHPDLYKEYIKGQ